MRIHIVITVMSQLTVHSTNRHCAESIVFLVKSCFCGHMRSDTWRNDLYEFVTASNNVTTGDHLVKIGASPLTWMLWIIRDWTSPIINPLHNKPYTCMFRLQRQYYFKRRRMVLSYFSSVFLPRKYKQTIGGSSFLKGWGGKAGGGGRLLCMYTTSSDNAYDRGEYTNQYLLGPLVRTDQYLKNSVLNPDFVFRFV
jgi:hypothetical protein